MKIIVSDILRRSDIIFESDTENACISKFEIQALLQSR